MRGCVLGPRKKDFNELALIKEGKKIFEKFYYIPIAETAISDSKVLYKNFDLSKLDFIIPRIPRTYVWHAHAVLSLLNDDVYIPIEPLSPLISHNKFLTLLFLKKAKIPIPETHLALSRQNMDELLDEMDFPVVIKLLYGSLGKGVAFADSKQSAISFMDTLERFKEPIFLEEYVDNPGEDIRILVLGNEVAGAMKRKARLDERRANIGIGGIAEPIELKPEYEDIAIKAAKALDMKICGIDIIRGPKGPLVIEANVKVQFQGLTKATHANIAKKIVRYVKNETLDSKGTPFERFFGRFK